MPIRIISASAGSGKTHDLCNRYLDALKRNGQKTTNPEHIIATTFSRKAASELKQRIRQKLLLAGLYDKALAVERGRIGTVHSVCLELLQEQALLTGLAPDFNVIPDDAQDWVFDLASSHILAQCKNDYQQLLDRVWPWRKKTQFKNPNNWEDAVKKMAGLARANGFSPDEVRKQAEKCWKSLEEVLGLPALSRKKSDELVKKISTEVEALKKRIEDNDLRGVADQYKKIIRKWDENAKWHLWRDFESIYPELTRNNRAKHEAFSNLRELASNYVNLAQFRDDLHSCIQVLFDCAADAMKAHTEWKRQHGLIDYADMEADTLSLLTNPKTAPKVKEALNGRISGIFVDEFQDTNPMQLQLFLSLAKLAQAEMQWIGDIKQAIYAFRGTDPELMQAAIADRDVLKEQPLKFSWRSRPCLVEFTNSLFKAAFAEGTDVELVPTRRDKKGHEQTGLRFGVVQGTNKPSRWRSLADAVEQFVASGEEVAAVLDEKIDRNGATILQTKEVREVTYGDIAILCRSNTDCKEVAAALAQNGIPVQLAPEGLETEPDVRLCIAAYYYAIHTSAVLPLLEMARLLGAEQANHDWLGAVIAEPVTLKQLECLKDILPALEALSPRLAALSPHDALQQVITILDEHVSLSGKRNMGRLLAKVKAHEEWCATRATACTHNGCLNFLNEQKLREEFARSGANAVTVLTYHGAKGLEWPVVIPLPFYADKSIDFTEATVLPRKSNKFELEKPLKGRLLQMWPLPDDDKCPLPDSVLQRLEGQERSQILKSKYIQEELRLLYVGLTRAKDILIIPYFQEKVDKVVLTRDWIAELLKKLLHSDEIPWRKPDSTSDNPCFNINDEELECGIIHFREISADDLLQTDENGNEQDDTLTTERPARPKGKAPDWPALSLMPSTLPAVKAEDAPKPSKKDIYRIEETLIEGEDEEADNDGDSGQPTRNDGKRGTLYHAWLAQAVLLKDEKKIKGRAEAFVEQWKDYAELWKVPLPKADVLVALRKNLLDGLDKLAEAKKLGELQSFRAEWPIAFTRTEEVRLEEEGKTQQVESVVSGFIDLLAVYENGTVIVDHKFKTSAKTSPDSAAREYASQLEAYREALTKVDDFGDNILCCLHMPVQGKLVVVPLK